MCFTVFSFDDSRYFTTNLSYKSYNDSYKTFVIKLCICSVTRSNLIKFIQSVKGNVGKYYLNSLEEQTIIE